MAGAIGYALGALVQFYFAATFKTNVKWLCFGTGILFVAMAGAKIYLAE